MARARWIAAGAAAFVLLGAGAWLLTSEDGSSAPRERRRPAAEASPGDAATPAGLPALDAAGAAIEALVTDESNEAVAVPRVQPAPPARPGARVTFRGIVTDLGGRPLPGARVLYMPNVTTLWAWDMLSRSSELAPDASFDDLPHVLTDGEGRFELASALVDPGIIDDASRAGEMNRPDPELAVTLADFATRWVTFPGFRSGERDAGTIVLEPGGSLSGRTVDEDGQPLGGATVDAHWNHGMQTTLANGEPRYVGSFSAQPFFQAVSDADGRFVLAGLSKDWGSLSIRMPGKLDLQVELKMLGEAEQRDLGDIVLSTGERMAGRVLDEHGTPLRDAQVWASVKLHPSYLSEGDVLMEDVQSLRARPPVLTDADGRYVVTALKEGRCRVFAVKPGYEPAGSRPIPVGTTTADVVLQRAASLVVTIEDAATGQPLEHATLTASRIFVRDQANSGCAIEVLEGDAARAALAETGGAAPAGAFFLVRPVGTVGTLVQARAPEHAAALDVIDGLEVGRSRSVTLLLVPQPPVTGRVLDPAGATVRAAMVEFRPDGEGAELRTFHRATTDDLGAYALADLSAGRWNVLARAPGFVASAPSPVDLGPGQSTTVPDIVLGATGGLRGRVIDRSGVPAADIRVSVQQASGPLPVNVKTSRDGTFALPALAPGRIRVRAYPLHAEASVDVVAGSTAEVLLVERPLAVLHGRVLGGGQPLANATVVTGGTRGRAWTSGGRPGPWGMTCITDATGTWTLSVEGGDIDILAQTKDGAASPTRAVHVEWGADITLDFVVGGVPLDCRVLDERDGKWLPEVSVELRWNEGHTVASQTTDDDGRCRFAGLVPGDYAGEVSLSGVAGKPFTLGILPDQQHADLTLTYAPGAILRGRLMAGDGGPVPDGTVVTTECPTDESLFYMQLSSAGAYEISGLAAGTYAISVHSPDWADSFDESDKPLAEATITLKPGETRTLDFTLDYGH